MEFYIKQRVRFMVQFIWCPMQWTLYLKIDAPVHITFPQLLAGSTDPYCNIVYGGNSFECHPCSFSFPFSSCLGCSMVSWDVAIWMFIAGSWLDCGIRTCLTSEAWRTRNIFHEKKICLAICCEFSRHPLFTFEIWPLHIVNHLDRHKVFIINLCFQYVFSKH